MPGTRKRRAGAWGALGSIGAVAAWLVAFVLAAALSAVVHLDTPAMRRVVTALVNGLLQEQFAGDVTIERLGGLGLWGIDGGHLRVRDPAGVQVLDVDGVRARAHALDIARSLLRGEGDVVVLLDTVSIAHADLSLEPDPSGNVRLAEAFAERTPTPSAPPGSSARGVRLEAPNIRITHVWLHGQVPGVPPLDVELERAAARLHLDRHQLRADVDRVALGARGLPGGVGLRGRAAAHLEIPSAAGAELGLQVAFAGAVGGVPTDAQARLDGSRLDAFLDARDDRGEGVRAAFGEVAIREPLTLRAEAHGELPRIMARASVALGRSTVDVDGTVDASEGTKIDARIAARHFDLRTVARAAPASDLGLDATVALLLAEGGDVTGNLALRTLPGTAAGQSVPIVKLSAQLAEDVARAKGNVIDPHASGDFDVTMVTAGEERTVRGGLRAQVTDLSRLPVVGSSLRGHASLRASGRLSLAARTFDARGQLAVGALAYGGESVDDATVVATAQGSLDHPRIDVGAHAAGIGVGPQKIRVADLRARIEPGPLTTLRDPHVDLVQEGTTISAYARRVQVGGPGWVVEGASVTGLGEPILADLSRDRNEILVRVDAPAIDLHRVATAVGRASDVTRGTLSVNGQVALRRDGASGEVHARVDELTASGIEGASLRVAASAEGKRVNLALEAEMGKAGTFDLAASELVLGGSPRDLAAWRRARGNARFVADLDLAALAALVPRERMSETSLGGRLLAAGVVRRDTSDVPPELQLHAHTQGLLISGKGRWQSAGVDVATDAKVDATSGIGEVALHVFDREGTLLAFDVKSILPYRQLVESPAAALSLLAEAPVSAKLIVPKRPLAELPDLVGLRGVRGAFEAELDVTGTVMRPRVTFVAHAREVRPPWLPELPADADVRFEYDGEKGDLVADVSSAKRRLLAMSAHVDLALRDLARPTGGPLAWAGSARASLSRFPLEAVSALADRQVRGRVSGEAVIENLHRDASFHTRLSLEQLAIGRALYTAGNLAIDAGGGRIAGTSRIEQKDGFVALELGAGLVWGKELLPSLDRGAPAKASLEAKAFRAAALLPFVQSQLYQLDGRIDAKASVAFEGGDAKPVMEGKLTFRDGRLQLAMLGEELEDARATVTFQPDGVVKVDDVFVRGAAGELTGDAVVRTRGLALESAEANVHIPRRRKLEASLRGQPIGGVSGDVKLLAASGQDGKALDVKIEVPSMEVELPQQIKSGVYELSERKKNIRVGTYRAPHTFVELPLDHQDLEPPVEDKRAGAVIDIDVRLGDITVVQGTLVRVVLGGNPHVRIGKTTEVTGQIAVKQGKINVQGKSFDVAKGVATFQPDDAANPIVVATAEWTADDGSRIYADFVGPVKTGKVTLRSDPARPRNEILAMILFGTADGANAAPAPPGRAPDGTTKAAVSLGGGFAAQGLTEAIGDLTGIQATARIDTTRSRNPAPEIEVQLARTVSIAFAHILGTPPLSEPDRNLAIVDWRFKQKWSLETTVGDRGKLQADAVWTKRY